MYHLGTDEGGRFSHEQESLFRDDDVASSGYFLLEDSSLNLTEEFGNGERKAIAGDGWVEYNVGSMIIAVQTNLVSTWYLHTHEPSHEVALAVFLATTTSSIQRKQNGFKVYIYAKDLPINWACENVDYLLSMQTDNVLLESSTPVGKPRFFRSDIDISSSVYY
ncbi:hypothetical protein BDN71DRAFT_1435292 [Pleurotus eryngii]|uniref:Uncharacterized protein n=1 Tax=Pleurotus eryngii TaxID=5323 RepID=A0A9P5ZLN4_PLEER|nr:hypothetical protein BDN71DRAFT_1435292 [Pleurotus eryngii]